jgi:hypothetical protein
MPWCSPRLDTFSSPIDSRTILAGVGHQKEYNEAGWLLQLPDVLPDVSDGDAEATREDA